MHSIDSSAFGKVEDFISTTDEKSLEAPDQPQKSLGEIAFISVFSKKDYEAAPRGTRLQSEKAALYLLEAV